MNKITFKDLPSTETPINATNLNAMQDNAETEINKIITALVNNKSTVTGTNITIKDSAEARVEEIHIRGNSIQDGTPTPDSPVEINSCGDNGSINETICNKNLLDGAIDNVTHRGVTANSDNSNLIINGTSTGSVSAGGKSFKLKAGTYTICLRYVSGSVNDTFYVRLRSGDTSIKAINKTTSNYTNDVSSTFTLTEETELNLNIYSTVTGIVFSNLTYKIQMVESSTADYDFVERIEQTYTIPTQKPFRVIGDYKDTFIKQDGVWYEKHYIEEVILDGTEALMNMGTNSGLNYFSLNATLDDYKHINDDTINCFCDYFKCIKTNDRYKENTLFINSAKRWIITSNKFASNDEFKSWLASNNVTINYVLETPKLIPCTTEQTIKLNEMQALAKTYKNTTHIFSEDEVSPEIEVTYSKDIATMLGGA